MQTERLVKTKTTFQSIRTMENFTGSGHRQDVYLELKRRGIETTNKGNRQKINQLRTFFREVVTVRNKSHETHELGEEAY